MAEHEVLALNANFENWKKDRGANLLKTEPYLYYSVEQITKRFNLTDEQIRYGITDDINDGGIDAVYCFVGKKNVLLRDNAAMSFGAVDSARVLVFQVKSSLSETGFKPEDIDDFTKFADALLSISSTDRSFAKRYTDRQVLIIDTFRNAFLQMAGNFPALNLEFYLVTRGDGDTLNESARHSERELHNKIVLHRGQAVTETTLFPVETGKMLHYARQRRQKIRPLRWAKVPMQMENGYVGMVKLADYFNFLKDEAGQLDELIFESNVRGSQGKSTVNRAMRTSLQQRAGIDFWQLNNGVTITCTDIGGVDQNNLTVEDAQVVNGLQTSRQLFAYFGDDKGEQDDKRTMLVKLIKVTEPKVLDSIIRATNNQNPMKASALRGTEDLQRNLEDLFKEQGLYYDRRPGFYKDQGKPARSIVDMSEVVQAILTIVRRQPNTARGRPTDYIRENEKSNKLYKEIFNSQIPSAVYIRSLLIIRRVEEFLADSHLSAGEKTDVVFYVSLYATCAVCRNSTPSLTELKKIELSEFTDALLAASLDVIVEHYKKLSAEKNEKPDNVAKGADLVARLDAILRRKYPPRATKSEKPKHIVRDVIKQHRLK